MATAYNDALDDPIIGDGNSTFAGGQHSSVPANTIPQNGFYRALNMDFDSQGRLATRRGAKSLVGNLSSFVWDTSTFTWDTSTFIWGSSLSTAYAIDALFYFDTYASEYIIVAQNGNLYQGTESAAFAAISSATYSGSLVYFSQLNNRLYYCDGVGSLRYIDSALGNQTITAGKVSSIRITNQGLGYTSVPAITFSSDAAAATAVLGYGGRVISATVTTPSSGYSATTPPTISFAAAPAGGTTATGIVNITQVPSKPKFITSHTNRLFCCSADTSVPPDTVYASDFLDGESWDLAGASVRVGGDGDPITGLYSWFGNKLLVFKQRSIWVINADPAVTADQWEISLINNRVGCVGHRTIQAVGSDVMFLSRTGVRSIAQIQAGTQTEVGISLSAPIQDVIDTIDLTYADYFCSAYYNNRYILGVATTGNTTPDTVIVYNRLLQSWCGTWTGWNPRDFCVTAFSGKIRLAFGSSSGRMWTWDDYTPVASETGSEYVDDTTDYESYVITRAYDHQDPLVTKQGYTVQISTENRMTTDNVTAYLYYDQDQIDSYSPISSSISLGYNSKQLTRGFNLLPYDKYRTIQFKFGTSRLKIALNSLAVTAMSDPIVPEFTRGESHPSIETFAGVDIDTFAGAHIDRF